MADGRLREALVATSGAEYYTARVAGALVGLSPDQARRTFTMIATPVLRNPPRRGRPPAEVVPVEEVEERRRQLLEDLEACEPGELADPKLLDELRTLRQEVRALQGSLAQITSSYERVLESERSLRIEVDGYRDRELDLARSNIARSVSKTAAAVDANPP